MAVLRKVYLLFWKNLVLLKRQYIVTACEILLPTLFTIALAYLRSRVQPIGSSYENEFVGTGISTFPEYSEEDMIKQVHYNVFGYYSASNIIGYTPESTNARRIMNDLVERINASGIEPARYNQATGNLTVTGFASEAEMEAFDLSNQMNYSYPRDEFRFGIVFSGLSDNPYPSNHKISYKIRTRSYINTKDLFPFDFTSGPGYSSYDYFNSMFSGLQLLLDKILIKEFTGQAPEYNISQQGFPYPEYKSFDIDELYYIFLPQFIVLGFVFVVPSIVRGAVSEKETGIKELMKMSGLPEWMHWLGWMLNSLTVLIITVTIIVILLFVPFSSSAGAVFKHSDFTLVWCVLMLYAIWATSYCFTVSAFFEKPTLATTIGIVVWIVSFYGLGLAMEESYGKDLALGIKLLLCIFPNVAIHLALKAICVFEAAEKGAKWGNMGDALSAVDSMTLLYTVLMLLVSICLNILICLYVEAVLPKKYGVRKPFYYIFLPSEWGLGRKKRANDSYEKSNEEGSKPGFEDAPQGIKAGVEIRKLRKEFGKTKVAVNDVSVNIYEGQIFCLLGQNGAGKTTSMSILTGLFAPTSGTALINGYDIRTDMEKIRSNLGLCPQHNMLFDKLTVHEHLKFFGMLKGMSAKEASDETMELLKLLQIEEKIYELSTSLSGGQKRRLSLGCALIGGSKVIFLDEPTSGMDPEARRAIWDLLLRIRGDRTILLTTHFMEEADVLGDRIAIMASGTLQCCGSPSFLKRFYGAGYTLSMTIDNGANHDSILSTVRGHVEDAHFKMQLSNNANELSIILPSDNNTSSKFPALFSELTDKQKGINEISVGWTTMDEVFIRVEELSHEENYEKGNADTESQSLTSAESKEEMIKPRASSGMALLVGQFGGLFMKKLMYSFRRKRLILSQMVIPVLLTIAAVVISTVVTTTRDKRPPLTITLDSYKDPVTLYSSRNETIGRIYANVVGSSGKRLDSRFNYDVSEGLLDVGRDDISFYRERHIIAAEINDTHMKGLYSTIAFHSAPLTMNVLANTLLRGQAPDKGYYIETINHPFPNSFYELLRPAETDPEFVTIVAIMFGVMIPIGLALLASSYLIAPTEERLCQGKQLQMMTGVNPILYWCSMFFCDYFLLLVTVCLMTACLPIFEDNKTFTNHNGAGIIFLLMAVYGLATISFSYVFSTFVRSVAGGFSMLTIVHIFTGVGLGIAAYLFEDLDPGAAYLTALNVIGRIFPTFGVTKGAISYAEIASRNSKCSKLTQQAKDILCSPTFNLEYFGYVSQECCDNCEELGTGECFKPEAFLKWSKEVPYYVYSYPYSIMKIANLPALTQDIVWLALIAVINFAVLMLVEYDVFQMLWEKISKTTKSTFQTFQTTVDDIDVLEENQRVHNLVSGSRDSDDAIVVENLCKSYGVFSAVSKLNFGVHHGECFGLLGVNGAGKTTSFRMLTGDETRSSGNAYMNSLSLVNGRKEFLSKLGYCPQFDGIIGVLTGKEMLRLFARLRGIRHVNDEADKWLHKAGLTESGNVQCQKYSGGMKRRLSAAMALIGDPPVILLDEPTSGVDPVARRRFWKIISSIKNSGQAIVLTSHSMEECEALCGRLAIMVNGEIQCFGGVQHLKNKFAQGYSLSIKLKEQCLQNPTVVDSITQSVCQTFDPCYLKDHHQISMKFHIQSKSRRWDDLYRTMEAIKMQFIDAIEEYAITETTLEEVFLSFARKQYVNERVTNSKGLLRFCRLPC